RRRLRGRQPNRTGRAPDRAQDLPGQDQGRHAHPAGRHSDSVITRSGTGSMTTRPRPRSMPAMVRRLTTCLAMPLGSVLLAFVLRGLIVSATGGNPCSAYAVLVGGCFVIG